MFDSSFDLQESERPAAVEEVCLAMGSAFRELHSVREAFLAVQDSSIGDLVTD